MLEAAVPTALFTVVFLVVDDLRTAVLASVAAAVVLLVVRLLQRSSPQFVLNAFFGIGIGAFFAWRAARGGGDQNDQALAYFLPGLLYNGFYSAAMVFSIVIRWPVVGFMIGSVTGDPTAWRADPQVVRLCQRLTWLLVAPCLVRLLVQGPIYLAAQERRDRPRGSGGRARHREAGHGLATPGGRAGRHGLAALPQHDTGAGGRRGGLTGCRPVSGAPRARAAAPARPRRRRVPRTAARHRPRSAALGRARRPARRAGS